MPKPESSRSSGADFPVIGASPSSALSIALSAVFGALIAFGANPAAEARDILRGGKGGSGGAQGAPRGNVNVPPSIQARAQAQNRLARTTQTVQAMQAMQKAARAAAIAGQNNLGWNPNKPGQRLPDVPNGLATGGLKVAPGVPVDLKNPASGEDIRLWQGAKLPKQTVAGGQTTVTIKQTAPAAVLNWETFNVGKQTTLRFDQSAGKSDAAKWIAFNKVNDPSGRPSQILGSIEAQGQVYVINRNGIIFGGSSQVNVHALVASALPINDNLVQRGLLNNPKSEFLFSGLATGDFTPPALPENGRYGDVVVQKGAVINSPTNAEKVGGRVALIGANVRNEGTISTPDGQTILAAGLQVGFAEHPSSDPSLRGLDVYIGAVAHPPSGDPPVAGPVYAGTATNAGYIDAPRANVTIAGKSVNQFGVIVSTTSVTRNGRIDLLADYNAVSNDKDRVGNTSSTGGVRNLAPYLFLPKSSGTVTIGDGSVTQILPELDSPESVVGTKLALNSQVNVQGRAVYLGNNATILAPNADVRIAAGIWNFVEGTNQRTNFVHSNGQIYMDSGAMIDVAGSAGISVPIGQNILSVELRGAEFADSPLQRAGIFRGLTINIDLRESGIYNGRIWVGTPLADASGYVGLIKRTVGELTAAGGTVTMNAGSSVVMQPGSIVDVSGGFLQYEGGMVQTTRIVSGGRLLDISQATPDVLYDGFYTGSSTRTYAKYGISETFTHPLLLNGAHFEPGYIHGASGGSIAVNAPSMALDGEFRGNTTAGPRQRTLLPAYSSLSLGFLAQELSSLEFPNFSPTPPNITFGTKGNLPPAEPFKLDENGDPLPLSQARLADVYLSPDLLTEQGFGVLKIDNSDGNITVPAGVTLEAPAGGGIELKGANITIDGTVSAPGGSLKFEVFNISQAIRNALKIAETPVTPAPDPSRGNFTLGASASLSTAGLIVDDRHESTSALELPLFINGGGIVISGYNTTLSAGSSVDASGGVLVHATGERTYGAGGSISVGAGRDLNVKSVLGGELQLDATLSAFSGSSAGSLTITAPLIQVGGTTQNPDTLLLSPSFFNQGGFGTFTLNAFGAPRDGSESFIPAIRIADNTMVAPVVTSFVLDLQGDETGGLTFKKVVRPEGIRTPVSLNFNGIGIRDDYSQLLKVRADVVLGAGAVLHTGAGGNVSLTGDTVRVEGAVFAPGGNITVSGAKNFPSLDLNATEALATVYLAPGSVLSAAGTTVLLPDAFGRRTGTVLSGGNISISGNIVAHAGATVDVSGTSGILDIEPARLGAGLGPVIAANSGLNAPLYSLATVPTRIDSNGGSIRLSGGQVLSVDAALNGAAGGPTALGGSLSVTSGRFYTQGEIATPLDVTLEVTQSGISVKTGGTVIGKPVVGAGGATLDHGYFAADTFQNGGFDSLSLDGTVKFTGPVAIAAKRTLTLASAGVLFADSSVNLSAPHVMLGMPFLAPLAPQQQQSPYTSNGEPYFIAPMYGSGRLTISGSLIDVGNLSLQNIGSANLIADGGDIRGNGTLNIAGDLTLRAGQIYPTTASTFTLTAFEKNIMVAASASGSPTVTLASPVLPPGFRVGSPLLGSTVESINGTTVTLASGANATIDRNTPVVFAPGSGSVTIVGAGERHLPMSAGGTLNVYAATITQSGVLRAPFGKINLGWDGTGTAPGNPLSGTRLPFPVTERLNLAAGSVTSVSGIDPITGEGVLIPYGLSLDGNSWLSPTGEDISAGGLPGKTINLAGAKVAAERGAVIDIRGGGDLYAYRWVNGQGGTQDVLASSGSFAVIPGYDPNYAPYAPFSPPVEGGNQASADPGYVNGNLSVGDRIYLGASEGLPAGYYTLLPARYALLPGAVLVTPVSGAPIGTAKQADGSSIVSGYRYNDLNSGRNVSELYTRFEVAPAAVVRARSEYTDFLANTFLREKAQSLDAVVPRLPIDAGHLIFSATTAMQLQPTVLAQAPDQGRGGLVDISSPVDIIITGPGAKNVAGKLVLDASQLSSWGVESLLIGGIRSFGSNGVTVTVNTPNLTVDNAGSPLSAPDIILVADKKLTLAAGAQIQQAGTVTGGADTLFLGSSTVAGSGDGTLLRISSDPSANIVRSGLGTSVEPSLSIGAGVQLSGTRVILDSTNSATIHPSAIFDVESLAINSGRISFILDDPGTMLPDSGLVFSGGVLQNLQTISSLSLLSYSTIDVYGTGEISTQGSLALNAGSIRSFNNDGGSVKITAPSLLLANQAGSTAPTPGGSLDGTLKFEAGVIRLGKNTLRIDNFADVELNASGGVIGVGTGGFTTQGNLTINTPLLTGGKSADQSITAGGTLLIQAPGGVVGTVSGGLGAKITLQGTSVTANGNISLPSGVLTLHATAGDVLVGGHLNVSGTSQTFFDMVRYTDAGSISLISDGGSVTVAEDGTLALVAADGGGNAGSLSIKAASGTFNIAGNMRAHGGSGGEFALDVASIGNGSLAALDATLNDSGFTLSRSMRIRVGDVFVDGLATARHYRVSADDGSITVTGTGKIDASGPLGGSSISLQASGSVTLLAGSHLTVAAEDFNSAGKGGAIFLEAGSAVNGVIDTEARLDMQAGSIIDLSVASNTADSAMYGKFTGTLHLRAPQMAGGTDVQINAINSTILGASSIRVEGYKLFTPAGGIIDAAVQQSVKESGNIFAGTAGTTTGTYTAMLNRLLAGNAGLEPLVSILAGAEFHNPNGDLTVTTDWDLSTYRFGAKSAPGVLTLRAAGDLNFENAALSDGFSGSNLWLAPLAAYNPLLPANSQSWSYRLTAGADLGAADFRQVKSTGALAPGKGSLLLGKNGGTNISGSGGNNAQTSTAIAGHFQVIRTGSGDIDINTGRDVQLLNPFATIYTAGTRVADPTSVFAPGDFVLPVLTKTPHPSQGGLGSPQQNYAAQYSMAGGNVSVVAQGNIEHLTRDNEGNLIADSQRQLPTNWLYRRGYVDPTTGEFGSSGTSGPPITVVNDPAASTTWWVDFSNFFQGVGALGGGDVTLIAGNDINNVDAVIPTNARMPQGKPDASKLLELGGGNLLVSAGQDINGGVYYVERGQGTLRAGNSIHTNSTRSPSLGILQGTSNPEVYAPETWLPTTLFVGKSSFDISARGDVLLGPVANPFLMPQGLNNKFWYKTYFNTYSPESAVNITSLGGTVTLRNSVTLPDLNTTKPILQIWMEKQLLLTTGSTGAAYYQPWLRLTETSVAPFATNLSLMPPNLTVTAFSGNINLAGNLTLFPAARGGIELAASKAINGLQPNGVSNQLIPGQITNTWSSSTINLSDANPSLVPGITTPFAYQTVAGRTIALANTTGVDFLNFITTSFSESGSTEGNFAVLQTKQALHAPGPLHADDPNPVRLYASTGDISGVTLFAGKPSRVIAGRDISDIALYIQNNSPDDVSIVASGRDIVAFNANSALRSAARSAGNALNAGEITLAGDIQISGPGTLQVLAGRNLDLGTGGNNPDGTGVGITAIGNGRNLALPFESANVIAAAGLGPVFGLNNSSLDFDTFIKDFLTPDLVTRYLGEMAATQPSLANIKSLDDLPTEQRNQLALEMFYLVLRDAGRGGNDPLNPTGSNYAQGFAAIDALFPNPGSSGDITTRARDIRTKSGGNISLLAPAGKLELATTVIGSPLAPPGIITESGGNISIFTHGNVDIGISRIFTLRGGNEIIWSSAGDIAAGSSSKTVQSAPPTRVLIDPQSADVKTDLAGLATGGGIGVLAAVEGVPAGSVDLIAPTGVVDAGDAGIRATGTVKIAATTVLNANNIAASGGVSGASAAPAVSAPSLGSVNASSSAANASASATAGTSQQARGQDSSASEVPSIITVEVVGYGGGDSDDEEEKEKKEDSQGNGVAAL